MSSPPPCRWPHCISETRMGQRSMPFSVSRYSWRGGPLLVEPAGEDPCVDELAEPIAEDVAGDAGVALNPVEAALAEERLAQDQHRVLVADEVDRAADAALVPIPTSRLIDRHSCILQRTRLESVAKCYRLEARMTASAEPVPARSPGTTPSRQPRSALLVARARVPPPPHLRARPVPPVAELLGLRGTYVLPGRVVFEYEPREEQYGALGAVHGGILTAVLDIAMCSAAQTMLDAGRRLRDGRAPDELRAARHARRRRAQGRGRRASTRALAPRPPRPGSWTPAASCTRLRRRRRSCWCTSRRRRSLRRVESMSTDDSAIRLRSPPAGSSSPGSSTSAQIFDGELPPPPIARADGLPRRRVRARPGRLRDGAGPGALQPDRLRARRRRADAARLGDGLRRAHDCSTAGVRYTTLEVKTNFVRPITAETGLIRCEGTVSTAARASRPRRGGSSTAPAGCSRTERPRARSSRERLSLHDASRAARHVRRWSPRRTGSARPRGWPCSSAAATRSTRRSRPASRSRSSSRT